MSARFLVAIVLILCAAGGAAAAPGITTLITQGDGGTATVRAAQQPVGTLSAGGDYTPIERDAGGELGTGGEGGGSPSDSDTFPSNGAGSAGAPAGGGGSTTTSLPFTGFLAIPLLAAGSALLLGGVALRRQATRHAA